MRPGAPRRSRFRSLQCEDPGRYEPVPVVGPGPRNHGFTAIHWSSVGDDRAPDSDLMKWAHDNDYVVFTNDLDFGAILAITKAKAPSVIQVRAQDVSPEHLADLVVRGLRQHEEMLEQGALISIDEARLRSRILPLVE